MLHTYSKHRYMKIHQHRVRAGQMIEIEDHAILLLVDIAMLFRRPKKAAGRGD